MPDTPQPPHTNTANAGGEREAHRFVTKFKSGFPQHCEHCGKTLDELITEAQLEARIDEAKHITHFCSGEGFRYVYDLGNGDKEYVPLAQRAKDLRAHLKEKGQSK